jgi:hypothetical protein
MDMSNPVETAMHDLLDEMAMEVARGTLLRNITARLVRNGAPLEAAEKLTRAVEVKANHFMHYVATH